MKLYGANHIETCRTKLGLALSYRQEQRHQEASPLFEECLPVFEEQLGAHSFEYCEALRGLAVIRRHQSRLVEAQELIQRAIVGYKLILGLQHP